MNFQKLMRRFNVYFPQPYNVARFEVGPHLRLVKLALENYSVSKRLHR